MCRLAYRCLVCEHMCLFGLSQDAARASYVYVWPELIFRCRVQVVWSATAYAPARPSARDLRIVMAAVAPDALPAGLASGAGATEGTEPPSGTAGVASPKAGAKRRARIARPRIDLDEQIAQANKLAEVSKKMLVAAKSAQKTQKKQKQRLIRKAGKLSAEDLERIAVLKRCGLYADDEEDAADTQNGPRADEGDDAVPVHGPADKKVKLSEVIANIPGSEVLMQTMGGPSGSRSGSGSASSRDDLAGRTDEAGRAVPRGKRLFRVASRAAVGQGEEEADADAEP